LPDKAQPRYRVEALDRRHDRDRFTCGAQALDRYLHRQARQDADKRVAAPFVLVQPPSSRVLGCCTLSASVICADDLPEELSRKLPRHPQLPVTLLGRLAIDTALMGQRMGQFLLMDALWRSFGAAAQIAAMAVVIGKREIPRSKSSIPLEPVMPASLRWSQAGCNRPTGRRRHTSASRLRLARRLASLPEPRRHRARPRWPSSNEWKSGRQVHSLDSDCAS
jgi:hypothetical protein